MTIILVVSSSQLSTAVIITGMIMVSKDSTLVYNDKDPLGEGERITTIVALDFTLEIKAL